MQYEECVECFQHENILKTIWHALQITELKVVNFCYEVKKNLKSILYLKLFSKILIHLVQLDNLINKIAEQFIVQCKFLNKINRTQENQYMKFYL